MVPFPDYPSEDIDAENGGELDINDILDAFRARQAGVWLCCARPKAPTSHLLNVAADDIVCGCVAVGSSIAGGTHAHAHAHITHSYNGTRFLRLTA